MRKEMLSLLFIMLMAVSLSACNSDSAKVPNLEKAPSTVDKVSTVAGDSLYNPKTLREVEELSEYIVKGKLQDDAQQKLESHESGSVAYGVTVSTLEISKVFKGGLKAGDEIPIAEKYYTVEENGKNVRYELGYGPSIPNQDYIFFLIKADDTNEFLHGLYSPMVKETGRYQVIDSNEKGIMSTQALTDQELNLVLTDPNVYRGIYQEVIDKYMK